MNQIPILEATYRDIPGVTSPLIRALPPIPAPADIHRQLTFKPSCNDEERSWPAESRLHCLARLSTFSLPFDRHVRLASTIDSAIRFGYEMQGRLPHTAEYAKKQQQIYDQRQAGQVVRHDAATLSQRSLALLGVPGQGKTTATRRALSRYPQVIFHPEINVYQIIWLHVELPADGKSSKALCLGIINEIDRLIPHANYYQEFARKAMNAEALRTETLRLLHRHCVGIVVADEVQNALNAPKGKELLASELVSMCNTFGIPLMFIGTNKAADLFDPNPHQTRRGVGNGSDVWEPLQNKEVKGKNEWHDFASRLWTLQWVKEPTPFCPEASAALFDCSQGIIDLAIKTFAEAQREAIIDGTETITPDLLREVFDQKMRLAHPMVEALKSGRAELLSAFKDVAPLSRRKAARSASAPGSQLSQLIQAGVEKHERTLAAADRAQTAKPKARAAKSKGKTSGKHGSPGNDGAPPLPSALLEGSLHDLLLEQ